MCVCSQAAAPEQQAAATPRDVPAATPAAIPRDIPIWSGPVHVLPTFPPPGLLAERVSLERDEEPPLCPAPTTTRPSPCAKRRYRRCDRHGVGWRRPRRRRGCDSSLASLAALAARSRHHGQLALQRALERGCGLGLHMPLRGAHEASRPRPRLCAAPDEPPSATGSAPRAALGPCSARPPPLPVARPDPHP